MEQDIATQIVGLGGASDFSLWSLFMRADFVVKFVIILLIASSIFSWALIFDKFKLFRNINSSIIETNGHEEIFQEGCLSLPGIALDVLRPEKVKLKYQTLDEQWHEDEFEGLLARAIQHEMDHLNGVFIVDRVSEIERIQYQKELKDLERKSKSLISSDSNQKGFVL